MSLEDTLKEHLHDIWVAIDFLNGTLENLCIMKRQVNLTTLRILTSETSFRKWKTSYVMGEDICYVYNWWKGYIHNIFRLKYISKKKIR